jgi:hypothetical protein
VIGFLAELLQALLSLALRTKEEEGHRDALSAPVKEPEKVPPTAEDIVPADLFSEQPAQATTLATLSTTALIPGCRNFTWHEALWLPTWGRHARPEDGLSDQVLKNLEHCFQKLQLIRDYFGRPISVHVAYRPEAYNRQIGGAKSSAHMAKTPGVAAVDFHVHGIECLVACQKLIQDNKLEEWGIRLEDNGEDAGWVHMDTRTPGPAGRFFKP